MQSKMKVLVLAVLLLSTTVPAPAQTGGPAAARGGWTRLAAMANGRGPVSWQVAAARPDLSEIRNAPQNEELPWLAWIRPDPLVGTWHATVTDPTTGEKLFSALHTFHAGGTFTESSDILVTLLEGPSFGVWRLENGIYHLTFELFTWDQEKKDVLGRIRVRATIRLVDLDHFEAESVVDFIAPDGTIESGIASGPFTGQRVKVVPIG